MNTLNRIMRTSLIITMTLVLAMSVGVLGEAPFGEAPTWWFGSGPVRPLSFYGVAAGTGLGAGWLLRRSIRGPANYERFERLELHHVKHCDLLVLPLAVVKGSGIELDLPDKPEGYGWSDLEKVSEVVKSTNLHVGWQLMMNMLEKGFKPDLVLLQGTSTEHRAAKGSDAAKPDGGEATASESITLLATLRRLSERGVTIGTGLVNEKHNARTQSSSSRWRRRDSSVIWKPKITCEDAHILDPKDCFDALRRQIERHDAGKRIVMDMTSGSSSMTAAVVMLGVTNGQILAYTARDAPPVFYDARIRYVSQFTYMSGT